MLKIISKVLLIYLCHNIRIRHIEMVNVKFTEKKNHKTGISASYSETGDTGAMQKKPDALTSFL